MLRFPPAFAPLLLLLLALACRTPDTDRAPDRNEVTGEEFPVWHLERLREWLAAPCGPGQPCDPAEALAEHPAVEPTKALYRRHAPMFSRGCSLSAERPPDTPHGRLVRWALGGRPALIFAGGCSPEPYFAILAGTEDVFELWRIFPGRLLASLPRRSGLCLLASHEGYGANRDAGLSLWECEVDRPEGCAELHVRWASDLQGPGPSADPRSPPLRRALDRDSALRIGPRVDDRPQESGLGFDWPGNLYQRLAANSAGWVLDEVRGEDGQAWSLAVFQAPPAWGLETDLLAEMARPHLARPPAAFGPGARVELLLGWLRTSDLAAP
jgi:hypothetical protein